MDKNYRINTKINSDKVIHVPIERDVDFLEILSLKINQEESYKLHASNYGIIVGRVLANNGFGIQNAKVSVFIELDDADAMNSDILNLYPYKSINTFDREGRRYNLLPDSSTDECYKVVGTFPNKRLVLDDDSVLEVYEKYWKYTTITNKSGDYMIFGVPTGTQQIHVDVDLSDIGILSQKPRDMIYKGYNITQFENANQFKESTNLDSLAQLISQTESVHVYPFWGDVNTDEIAITRCDLNIQYLFEPTCVFFGSVITDNYSNNIGHNCSSSKFSGFNRNLVTTEGTIEMIRETVDGLIEEYQIQGNRLIDGDGVWCYQIPMNLDYVTMDEYGNLIPSDNPNIGIPTRTRVRFRFSSQETSNEGVARHRAKYLVPNNPEIVSDSTQPKILNGKKFTQCFEFGSATPKEYFRDLYWNKVYTVKNYIPRVQNSTKHGNQNYNALRTTNDSGDLNPIPFNKVRLRLVFAFRILCLVMTIVAKVINFINSVFSFIANICLRIKIFGFKLEWCPFKLSCVEFSNGLTEDTEENIMYIPGCYGKAYDRTSCTVPGCTKETDVSKLIDTVEQVLSQEYDIVNLDFYNDWLNGTLYMPLWYWKKTKKKKFLFGLFTKKATNSFCNCDKRQNRFRIIYPCSLDYNNDKLAFTGDADRETWHQNAPTFNLKYGVIKEVENDAGLKIYYYTPGNPITDDYQTNDGQVDYIRLYSTDIVNLGSLNSCDMDGLPQPFLGLPSTTANIPYIATIQEIQEGEDGSMATATSTVEITGMDWGHDGNRNKPKYGRGLFLDLGCSNIRTKAKTCINLERMCELGVSMDMLYTDYSSKGGDINSIPMTADGMITRYELDDNETRAMFASLNYAKSNNKILNKNTGYYTDKFKYIYPIDFDGRMSSFAPAYSSGSEVKTYDYQDMNYLNFRFGTDAKRHFYGGTKFPVYDNSFYFYFGLHEGSTAIDKFNSMFFSECYQNKKYPFIMQIDKSPGKWCYNKTSPNVNEDFGMIEVTLESIRTPYTYELIDTNGNTLIEESNMYSNQLVFGAKIKNGGGEYEIGNDGKFVKYGALCYFNSGEELKPRVLLTNGTYNLKITDNKGQVVSQIISLEQNSINMTYTVTSLGNKFYNLELTKPSDICNNQQFYGEISISNFIIDGETYTVNSINNIKTLGDGKYQITVNSNGKTEMVLLQITPLFYTSGEEYTFNTCLCNGVNGINSLVYNNGILTFNVWIPGDYQIVLTQYCYGQLNDNTTTIVITVDNGSPFNVLLNQVPLTFLLGKIESPSTYNSNFWNPNANNPNDLKGWFGLHDSKYYKFPTLSESDLNIWEEFISDISYDSNDNLTNYSKTSIIEYKLQSMFNMAYGCYITEDSSASLQMTSVGGKKPILLKTVYPDYTSLTGEEDTSNTVEYIIDSNGYVTCNTFYPNIVGKNYSRLVGGIPEPFKWNTNSGYFNPLFNPTNKLGNYFAAFTKNGGFVTDSEGDCRYDSSIKYQKVPDLAKSVVTDDTCGSSSGTTEEPPTHIVRASSGSNPYFRGEFVDRRLDYDLIVITPYMGDGNLGLVDNSETWRLGRISGCTFNGIEMAYDKNYNIVSSNDINGTEYTYNVDNANVNYNSSNNANLNRNYYTAEMKCGSTKIDLKPYFWTKTNKKPSAFGLNDFNDKNQNEPFYFDHNNDNFYNGMFDANNYPIIRLIDIGNLPNGNKYTMTLASCSYSNLVIERSDSQETDIQDLNVYIEEGDKLEVDLDCRNMVTMIKSVPDDGSLNETAYNVLCNYNGGNNSSTLSFKSYAFKGDFSIKEDSYNETHNIQTQIPKIVALTLDNNCFLHKLKTVKSVSELESVLNNNGEKCNCNTPEGCYWEGDVLYYSDSDPKARVFDDSQEFKKVIFSSKSSNLIPVNNTWGEIKLLGQPRIKAMKISQDANVAYLLIFFQRFYYNNSNDFLYKYIRVIECGSMIDIRPFRLKLEKSEYVENGGSVEVPVDTGSTGETREGEEGEEGGGTTTEPTYNLKTTFKLLFDKDNENKSFTDGEKVGIKYIVDLGRFRVSSEATEVRYIEEENALSFVMLWDGDLANLRPNASAFPPTIKMYISSPNGFTYALSFKIPNGETITSLLKDDDF